MDTRLTILVVEDNDDLREAIIEVLETQGHSVQGVDCAESAHETLATLGADLLLIDLNLPGEDGLSLASRMREVQPGLGIIMITARAQQQDRTAGYLHGADIYLTKPISLLELAAAIQSLSRRLKPLQNQPWQLHQKHALLRADQHSDIPLTATECTLLAALIRAPGQRMENWELLALLERDSDNVSKAALELHIVRLRKKLQLTGYAGQSLRAIRNWGYQLCHGIQLA